MENESRYMPTTIRSICGVDTTLTPRDALVDALSAVGSPERASAIVDALDAYLAQDPADRGVTVLGDLTPNLRGEVDKLRVERDRAIAVAESVVRQMQSTLDSLRSAQAPTKMAAE